MVLKRAFTLIEIMVVMSIIAVLAVLVIGAITQARKSQEETIHRSNAKSIQGAMEGFYTKNRAYCDVGGLGCGDYNFKFLAGWYRAIDLPVTINDTRCDPSVYDYFIPTAYARRAIPTLLAGGGYASISSQSYILYVANADCSEYNDGDRITVQ